MNKFKVIASHLPLVEYSGATEGDDPKFTFADINCLINNTADILLSALDAVAPLKKRVSKHRSSYAEPCNTKNGKEVVLL